MAKWTKQVDLLGGLSEKQRRGICKRATGSRYPEGAAIVTEGQVRGQAGGNVDASFEVRVALCSDRVLVGDCKPSSPPPPTLAHSHTAFFLKLSLFYSSSLDVTVSPYHLTHTHFFFKLSLFSLLFSVLLQ
eukprot:SAG11_NODE_1467_length_4850_cov_7.452957_4_plen_131_part_00